MKGATLTVAVLIVPCASMTVADVPAPNNHTRQLHWDVGERRDGLCGLLSRILLLGARYLGDAMQPRHV